MASSYGREGFIISTNPFWVNRFRQLEVIAGELTAVKLSRFQMATPILSTLSTMSFQNFVTRGIIFKPKYLCNPVGRVEQGLHVTPFIETYFLVLKQTVLSLDVKKLLDQIVSTIYSVDSVDLN